jgi:hypothetical protein
MELEFGIWASAYVGVVNEGFVLSSFKFKHGTVFVNSFQQKGVW